MQVERQKFYDPEGITQATKDKVKQSRKRGEPIDYLTFVPDGEPTLDANLGGEIGLFKSLDIKIAVITNGSLIWREDVRQDLQKADWVSLKVDVVTEKTWHRINGPHKSLKLEAILHGMLRFRKVFGGEVTTETMLVRGINDDLSEIERLVGFLAELKPDMAYLAIPTRPPAESFVAPASEQTLNGAYQIFSKRLSRVEYLIGYEGNAFACTGNAQNDILSITAVHPMREDAVAQLLKRADTGWGIVEKLIRDDKLLEVEYQGNTFYIRKLPTHGDFFISQPQTEEPEKVEAMSLLNREADTKRRNDNPVSPFDDLALEYDAWFDREGHLIFLIEVQAFRGLLSSLPKPWLEIGVGSGRFAQALGIETGVDPSIKLVEMARRRDITAFLGRGEQELFEEESFGTVFLIVTLCFLESPLDVLKEVQRILMPGGKIVLGLILKESSWGKYYQVKKAQGHRLYRYATFYKYDEVLKLLDQAGFSTEKVVSTVFQRPGKVDHVEEPVGGYSPNAGFTIAVAGKREVITT